MKKKKVVLGMSGGMDSSAAAVMLVEQGYEVHGITLKVWHEEDNPDRKWQERSCCKVGIARYVAQQLGIPHEVIDLQDTFREVVVNDFVSGYLNGKTPNPCVRCNERIKFGVLHEAARKRGADFLATGHYVRVGRDDQGNYCLMEGVDQEKDQSYFLYRLRPEILPDLIFPLGSYRKKEIGKWIEVLDLPPDEMRESQEICFVTQGDYRKFLKQEAPHSAHPGQFVSTRGSVLGEHEGIAHYTVGQRRGLGISSSVAHERLYVIHIDPATNRIQIGPEDELYCEGLTAGEINVIHPALLSGSMELDIRYRYRSRKIRGVIEPSQDQKMVVTFKDPQRAVSCGQSIVFYQEDQVLGGGIIESVRPVRATVT